MKLPLLKTTSLAFAIALTAATGTSLLTGCSSTVKGGKQAQAPTNTTEV